MELLILDAEELVLEFVVLVVQEGYRESLVKFLGVKQNVHLNVKQLVQKPV